MLSTLSFQHPFRKYQRMILGQVEAGGTHAVISAITSLPRPVR